MFIEAWWEGLDWLSKVLYCIAIPASVILIVQTIMTLLGFGEGGGGINPSDTSGLDLSIGTDMDTDVDINLPDSGDLSDFGALRLFTLQGIIAFLTVFSWTAIVSYHSGLQGWLAVILGFFFGGAAMYGVAKLIQLSGKLAGSGNISLKNALGEPGQVYLPIPSSGLGRGKINLTVQERFIEADAITDSNESIPVGSSVRVVDIRSGVLVVEKD